MHTLISTLNLAIKNNHTSVALATLDEISKEDNSKEIINQADKDGMTPLHQACIVFNKSQNNIFIINKLVTVGADFTVFNNQGKTPAQLISFYTPVEQQEFVEEVKTPLLADKEDDVLLAKPTHDIAEESEDDEIEMPDPLYTQMSKSRKKLHTESKQAEEISKKVGNSKLGTAGFLIILWGMYAALMSVTADQYANPSHRIYPAPGGYPPPPPVNEEKESTELRTNLFTYGIMFGIANIALTFLGIYFARSTYTSDELRKFHDSASTVDTTAIDEENLAENNRTAVLKLRQKTEAARELHAAILQETSPTEPLQKIIETNKKVQEALNVANHPLSFYTRLNTDPSIEPVEDKVAEAKLVV